MADTTSLHLRLPKRLYKRLQRYAKSNNVSLNTQIINQLEANEAAFKEGMNEGVKEGASAAAIALILKFTAGLFGPDQDSEEERRWRQRVLAGLQATIDEMQKIQSKPEQK
jgi:hypothetical protein